MTDSPADALTDPTLLDEEPRVPYDHLAAIVTGSTPEAEWLDRPSAYHLQSVLARRLARLTGADIEDASSRLLVMGDLWRMNDSRLVTRPAITIGPPGRNALAAHLRDRVPPSFVIEDLLMVQMDAELGTLDACCWGVTAAATAAAVDVFIARFADRWLEAVAAS